MSEDEDTLTFFPAVFGRKPTRRLGEDDHAEEEDDSGNHLKRPRNAEGGGRAANERAPVGDVDCDGKISNLSQTSSQCSLRSRLTHDHDAPSDCPLLHAHEATALRRRCDLGNVDWNLSRTDADTEAIDDATDDEHGDVLRGGCDDRTNHPDHSTDHDSLLAAEDV